MSSTSGCSSSRMSQASGGVLGVDRGRDTMNYRSFEEEVAQEMPLNRDLRGEQNAASSAHAERPSLQERSREAWNWTWLQSIGQDLRYGMRTLAADRAFTIASLVSLAIG